MTLFTLQKRKTTTISVEVKKSQHKYIIGPKGNTLQEILEATGVSVEMPPLDSSSETIILRGEPDKLGPALTQVYAKVRGQDWTTVYKSLLRLFLLCDNSLRPETNSFHISLSHLFHANIKY